MKAPEDQQAILARFMEGPALLERVLAGIEDAVLDAARPQGRWTIREIVHHIADGDDLWKIGIKAAMGNRDPEFSFQWYWVQPQEDWARSWAYANRSIDVSLALLQASRNNVYQLLGQVPDGWHRSVKLRKSNGEVVPLPAGAIVEMQTDHLEHHVKQIRAIRAEFGGA